MKRSKPIQPPALCNWRFKTDINKGSVRSGEPGASDMPLPRLDANGHLAIVKNFQLGNAHAHAQHAR